MSNDTRMTVPGKHGAAVEQTVQYGIRFPDDTTAWTTVPGTSIDIAAVVEPSNAGHQRHAASWEGLVAERARAAKIDLAEYGAAHQFIRRTIVIAVTDTEDVS